ncbi:hydrogenase nickel incorporation protein HypB [Nodularia harveyana UHCC-0300]|uniref:Hydrogenase nickel incorporation protein HypB n=1 Tax=Nodularia harveyana UHCC-0300 TaxID=2974287 RepID=A0ABU5UHY0_9CYAN|nr:hydrogenase nickel incorporation protein HypB [Nodularia harveyana]MEA5583148.1 hydrogenase nickel incorporation protein HypB [Nodularia harveyana UHCC-0300]
MCVTCGCSDDAESTITNLETGEVEHNHHDHTHTLPDGTVITHSHHEPSQVHAKIHNTTISLEQDILAKNNLLAAQNRGWFKGRNILALNLMSSPGSGKTTLLTRTIHDLKDQLPISVIEGDQETANDARKIQETGCKVVQINTGTGCHLEASMIDRGLQQLNPPLNSVVMIENVGNLVCPALFDLGEQAKVVILSVTEGEDKPIKYPHIFCASNIMILTKVDLLPYVQFDVQKCLDYARQVNPQIQIFQVSATTGVGLAAWYEWLTTMVGNLSLPGAGEG